MTRQQHLQWCKDRAMEYVKKGDAVQAISSMLSDLGKHEETKKSAEMGMMLSLALFSGNRIPSQTELTNWVQGFN